MDIGESVTITVQHSDANCYRNSDTEIVVVWKMLIQEKANPSI